MGDIEYFVCECVYHKYGYVLCRTCASIIGARKRSVFVNRWHRYKRNCQTDESNDIVGPVPKHDD